MLKTYSERLIQVLNLVAAEADVQISAFPTFVHIPDEIADEISDAIEYAPTTRSNIDSVIIKALSKIDATLDGFAGKEEFWTQDSIKNDSTWNQLRQFARNELDRLNLPQTTPNLFWVTYSQQRPNF